MDGAVVRFVTRWLGGFTPARLGVLVLACAIMALRNGAGNFADFALGTVLMSIAYLPLFATVIASDAGSADGTSAQRGLLFALAVVIGAALSTPLWESLYALAPSASALDRTSAIDYASRYFRAILFGGLLAAVLFFATRQQRAADALRASRLKHVDLERQMTEARLQVLQAQIEPHFLFNTLATVKRLYEVDADGGRRMLRGLSSYLTGAIAQMRGERSTLRGELAMIRGYLDVIKVRMEDRLHVEVEVPDDLQDERVPPMMVATLVENAVKHGINPRPRGGAVRISARRAGANLRIEVSDDGVGFDKSSGSGVGLANTRARLATLFGGKARLVIHSRSDGGTLAAIELPCDPVPLGS